jgi:ribosomal protein S18 acetylase RimI-like enzyme
MTDCVAFEERHLAGVMRLAADEGWPSLSSDESRARRALTAPGVRTVVALDGDEVVGFAHALTDGETTAYLSVLVVDTAHRRRGIGRQLVAEVFRRCGVGRVDLLAMKGSEDFYRSLPHRTKPGYRLYPPS